MDRRAWLAERRAAVIASYDAGAPAYDQHDYPWDLQREWVTRTLDLIPPGGIVLDAPYGTGGTLPWSLPLAIASRALTSLRACWPQARRLDIAFSLEHTALQDLSYAHEFDAVLTIDAMENTPPDDWPLVLANLHRAVRPGGVMYLTVEEVDQSEIDQAFDSLSARRLPVVRGEIVEGDVAGYHYYPGREQVLDWFVREGPTIADEGFRQENGWGYRHFLLRTR